MDGSQVTANLNLCTVEEGLVLVEDLLVCSRAAEQRVGCQMEILLGSVAHVGNAALRLIECQGRRGQEARLQLCQRVLLRLLGTLAVASLTSRPVNGRNSTVQVRLNSVWKFAMPPLSIALSQKEKPTVY